MILVGQAGTRRASLELSVSEFGSPATPADRDVLLNVTVAVGAYKAADQVWITEAAFARFLSALSRLEETRRGQATLETVSPGEFTLTLEATDAAGHLAVRGQLADRTPDGFRLSLSFAFSFDPGNLGAALAEFRSLR